MVACEKRKKGGARDPTSRKKKAAAKSAICVSPGGAIRLGGRKSPQMPGGDVKRSWRRRRQCGKAGGFVFDIMPLRTSVSLFLPPARALCPPAPSLPARRLLLPTPVRRARTRTTSPTFARPGVGLLTAAYDPSVSLEPRRDLVMHIPPLRSGSIGQTRRPSPRRVNIHGAPSVEGECGSFARGRSSEGSRKGAVRWTLWKGSSCSAVR